MPAAACYFCMGLFSINFGERAPSKGVLQRHPALFATLATEFERAASPSRGAVPTANKAARVPHFRYDKP